jgi:hypothetical protein
MTATRTHGVQDPEVGWIFEVDGRHPGMTSTAEILEVIEVPGYTMFRVRWNDGSESILLPPNHQAQVGPMSTMRRSSAYRTRSARVERRSLSRMWRRWASIVRTLRKSWPAISWFV